jgi:hypothetical protein
MMGLLICASLIVCPRLGESIEEQAVASPYFSEVLVGLSIHSESPVIIYITHHLVPSLLLNVEFIVKSEGDVAKIASEDQVL